MTGEQQRIRRPLVVVVGPRPDSRGGVAATLRVSCESSLVRQRYDATSVATFRDGSLVAKAIQFVAGLARIVQLLAFRDVAIVHLHASNGISYLRKAPILLLARLRGSSVVFHVHPGPSEAERRRADPMSRLTSRALAWSLRRADVVVALTPGWASELERFAPVERMRVIPNAPDFEWIGPRNGRRDLARPMILFLGHLYREKGVYELLDAIEDLRKSRPGLRLVMAGVGSEDEALRAKVRRRQLHDSVELPGWVSHDEKVELISAADCMAIPSYEEGLPLVLLEAMEAGLPVVATPVGGVAEVVRDRVEALLVPPRDSRALAAALDDVLTNPEAADGRAKAARARATEYGRDALGRRVRTIYDELLGAENCNR
jgi:glycosyltransferase involved in cell wall biosynthesis